VRRYSGFFADSARWERFRFREGDVVISTPSKCGTTWMQNIVGSLILDRPVLGAPIGNLSPWLDMLIRTDDEVFGMLDAQQHRRWIKTHTPIDGLPLHPTVTYFAVIRHPLDVALSDRDHRSNMDGERALELRTAAAGTFESSSVREPEPADVGDYLRWFIDNDAPPTGSGPNGLADFCQQASTYWEARSLANVHSSTTRTCGRTWAVRCTGLLTRSASQSMMLVGPSSWTRRRSTRCAAARPTPRRTLILRSGMNLAVSFGPVAGETGSHSSR
jgi:Sulfotransferase domain